MSKNNVALIIGNGPSLQDIPIEFLNKYPSFGANGIFLKRDFRSTYYVAINPLVVSQMADKINQYKPTSGKKYIRKDKSHLIKNSIPLTSIGPCFSMQPLAVGVYEGYTVTFVSIQLAVWMGYTTILFVGLDHSYQCKGRPNESQVWQGDDVNHFHPDYFKSKRWNLPDLEKSTRAYQFARNVCDKEGVRLVNLSTKTELSEDIFPRDSYKNWLI